MIQDAIQKLLEDSSFSRNETYTNLFKFLADCTEKNEIPHELEIAKAVFGKDNDFNPTLDPLVRVHISKLRNRIKTYYQTKGKNESFQIQIPPRHYQLELVEKSLPKGSDHKKHIILLWCVIFVLGMGCFILSIRLLNKNQSLQKSDLDTSRSVIWSSIFKDNKPTITAIGHIYTFDEFHNDIGHHQLIRDSYIHHDEALKKYINENNIRNEDIRKPEWEIIPKSSLVNYSKFQSLFEDYHKRINFKISSKLNWNDFTRNHIIYIGHYHNLGMLDRFFKSTHFYSPSLETDYEWLKNWKNGVKQNSKFRSDIKDYPESLYNVSQCWVKSETIDTVYTIKSNNKTEYTEDYVVLAKYPGPENNSFLFLISNSQIGRMEVVKILTTPHLLEDLEDEISDLNHSDSAYFELLLEIKGYEETAMQTRILHFFEVSPHFKITD